MSKQNNVNPDYYKLAGRERPGKTGSVKARARSTEADEQARWTERKKSGVNRVKAEAPAEDSRKEEPPKQKPEL
jgi:hypothetical protein